jgi:hypothetical protein
MNKLIHCAALAVLALAASTASAAVTVTYANPDNMTDVPRSKVDRDSMEAALLEHFKQLAARLPAGQTLKVEILDIDLAGDVFPRVAIHDVRVMKGGADWPRIHLRYSIEQDGKVLISGERQLADMNYLMGTNRYRGESFPHEKQMLDDWFRKDVLAVR